jgi:hypothetical protein
VFGWHKLQLRYTWRAAAGELLAVLFASHQLSLMLTIILPCCAAALYVRLFRPHSWTTKAPVLSHIVNALLTPLDFIIDMVAFGGAPTL